MVVGEDPPYLQAEVEWLGEEEAAEEAAGDAEGLASPRPRPARPPRGRRPGRWPCWRAMSPSSFARYVAEVAVLRSGAVAASSTPSTWPRLADLSLDGAEDGEPATTRETRRRCSARSPTTPTALSYLVASAALLTTEDRQALLAESATRRRLAAESRLLRRELTLLRELGAVPVAAAVVRHPDDGQLTGQVCGRAGGTSTSGRSGRDRRTVAPPAPGAGSRPAGPMPSSSTISAPTHVDEHRRERRDGQRRRWSRASAAS